MSEEVVLKVFILNVEDSFSLDSVKEAASLAIYSVDYNESYPHSIIKDDTVLWDRERDGLFDALESIVHFCKHGYTLKLDGWYKSGRYQFSLDDGVRIMENGEVPKELF